MLERELGDVADEALEQLVLGDEIGLGVDLDDRAATTLDGDSDEALGGGAAGLLGRSREALGAKPVDRGFHFAIGFRKRLLAVHHSCARALAQFLHARGRDLSHFMVLSFPGEGRGPVQVYIGPGSRVRRSNVKFRLRAPAPPAARPFHRCPGPSPALRPCGPRSLPGRPNRNKGGSPGWRRRCPGPGRRCRSDRCSNRGPRRPGCRACSLP